MRAPTAFLLHPSASLHDAGWGHPEHQGRLRFLSSTVGRDMLALHGRVVQATAGEAGEEDLLRVHTRAHVERVRESVAEAARSGGVVELDPDTRASGASWDAALGSLGAALTAAGGVAAGRFRNAFVAARPPGHHATPDRTMGFCLFNTVAATARWLQAHGHADRVLIVDWDGHHGNGTQDIFWEDASVYLISLHQSPWWPGTGAASERGGGVGVGTTLNVPLPAGTTAAAYHAAFTDALDQALADFTPDLVLISAGFDALAGDPLVGGLMLEPPDFHRLTREVMTRADAVCGGRVVALLEGGYDPKRTGLAAVAVLRALADIMEADPTAPVTGV
ncbi:MAG: histone deacetylase [Longimicrobiales bacterium]|nr:histone deacetylase [Longimicrobiales bacterium]